jgi:uridine kinase
MLPASARGDCVRVAVDGVDGAGKTVFADELAHVLTTAGTAVIRISADDFHHVRAVRYARGRSSPEGFWLDSYNYERLHTDVLTPLGPRGSRRYRAVAHDLTTDTMLDPPPQDAPAGAVLVLDGLFLHRDELATVWDFSVFLDVPFELTARRMASRDGTNPDPADASMRRYVEAQRIYISSCAPADRASIVIDNSSFGHPRIDRIRPGYRGAAALAE